jgi:AcrR family transcriptional regulator
MRNAQRHRILLAAAETARQIGFANVTVTEIVLRAGVSRRTFYELFESREDALLAVFEEAIGAARAAVVPAYEREDAWLSQMRAALAALLRFLDAQPALGRFVMVDAFGGGNAMLERRTQVIAAAVDAVDMGRALARSQKGLSRMTTEGLVGGVLSIVHTRLLASESASLLPLLGPLMSILVRPYLGAQAAAAELDRDPPPSPPPRRPESEVLRDVRVRWTYRTILVLSAIAGEPGVSNRRIATMAGIADQGQTSKLLSRLEGLGLVVNGNTRTGKEPNAWRLTQKGAELEAIFGKQIRDGRAR